MLVTEVAAKQKAKPVRNEFSPEIFTAVTSISSKDMLQYVVDTSCNKSEQWQCTQSKCAQNPCTTADASSSVLFSFSQYSNDTRSIFRNNVYKFYKHPLHVMKFKV